jgi:CheY-like chemotaxis protein
MNENAELRRNRVLIVDDNQSNCELLEAYLANIDCDIDVAMDGRQALEKARSFQPDLILLDVMMPKLSGFEVCQKIKQDAELKKIMVLMVTALNELGDIERAIDAGTNDFLSKPVQKLELLKRVENLLALKGVTDENELLRQYIQRMEEESSIS